MLRRDRPVRVKKQRAAAEQKQRHRAAGQAVPEQPFQPVSAPDCATAQDIRRRVDEQNEGNGKALCAVDRKISLFCPVHTYVPSFHQIIRSS